MIKVEKVDCTNFLECQDVLSEFLGPGQQEHWRRIFEYQWPRDETYCGLALKDGDQTVGFLGMIFSRRRVNGKIEKFCNLTHWFVQKPYRSRAISLLLPLFAMRDHTITDLTPSRKVYRIQKKLGFKDLDARGRVLLPFGRRLFAPKSPRIQITHEPSLIKSKLAGGHLKILNHHLNYPCSHLLAAAEDRYCYIIYAKQKNKRLNYAHVHFISDPDFFSLVYRDIRQSILSESKACYILIDSRFVRNLSLPISFSLPFRAPKQYLSPTLKPEQIDNLYSEIMLLNLRTHARFKYVIRNIWRKVFGSN
jgi:hypothetical protein